MTTTVTSFTTGVLSSTSYDDLSTSIGLVLIVVLGVLLAMRDFAPIIRGSGGPRVTRAFDMALAPLLVVFGTIVLARLAELLK